MRWNIGRLWHRRAERPGRSGDRPSPNKPKIDREYVSDFHLFMQHFVEEHPEIEADRAEGRGMYWDRKIDLAGLDKVAEDSVPTEPYSYFSPFIRSPRNDRESGDKPAP